MIQANTPNKLRKKIITTHWLPVSVLVVFVLLYVWMCNRMEIVIYHGPYSAYTPIILQKRIQDKYDKELPIWNFRYLLRADVETDEKLDYMHSWFHKLAMRKRKYNKAHLYSINTVSWLKMEGITKDSLGKLSRKYLYNDFIENDSLYVIGYKKQDIIYYMPLFVWHADSLMFDVDALLKTGRRFVMNQKNGSGCSYMVPTIYLLEKYGHLPMFLMSKKDIVQEVVQKKQLIGVISTDEYSDQLDDSQKKELFIEPIPVNIPLDPIVVKHSEWMYLSEFEKDCLKKMLIEKNIMIDINNIEGRRMRCLGKMLYFYLSMPILHALDGEKDMVNVVQWGIDDYKQKNTNYKKIAYLCKVNYASLGNDYYSFVKEDICLDSISEAKPFLLNQQIAEKVRRGYNRVVFHDESDEFDRLLIEYVNCFR